jgi:hypothetical protein
MNPNKRTERDGVPVAIYDEPNSVTTATGSYGLGHGISLTMHEEYLGEVPDAEIESDIETLKAEAIDRLLASMDEERMTEDLLALKRERVDG